MDICVVGLGKLGSPLAAVLASKGHNVTGVDLNAYFVDALNEGRAPVVEPQLQETLPKVGCGRPVPMPKPSLRPISVSLSSRPRPMRAAYSPIASCWTPCGPSGRR
jgi:6-phosphogluconate dehydrogenase (decarboxylating)